MRHTALRPEPVTGPPPATFTLGDLVAAILRHKLVVVCTTFFSAAAAFGVATQISAHYTSEAALISDASMSGILDADSGESRSLIDPSATTTIVETLATPVVLERATAALPPGVYAQLMNESGIREWIATSEVPGADGLEKPLIMKYMSQNLSIFNSGRSYVIHIYYKANDPASSAAVANAVANAYLAYRVELKRNHYAQLLGSLGNQVNSLKAELDAADGTAQTKREQGRLLAARSEALTGQQQDAAIAESASLFASQREAERQADATASVYEKLLRNQRELQSRLATPELDVQLFAQAVVPLDPSGLNPKPVLLVLGTVGGFFVGVSLALIRDRMRRKPYGRS